jgi:hypothetical protein
VTVSPHPVTRVLAQAALFPTILAGKAARAIDPSAPSRSKRIVQGIGSVVWVFLIASFVLALRACLAPAPTAATPIRSATPTTRTATMTAPGYTVTTRSSRAPEPKRGGGRRVLGIRLPF